MSFHRENVVWKSSNGSWGIGFFESIVIGDDPEWDVDYNYNEFEWVSTGHPTQEHAHRAWTGSNPGASTVYDAPSEQTEQFDDMARRFLMAQRSVARASWR